MLDCARSEAVPLEREVEQAFARAVQKYRDRPSVIDALQSSKSAWNAYRDSECAAEGSVQPAGFEVERAVMKCVLRAYQRRLQDLEAL